MRKLAAPALILSVLLTGCGGDELPVHLVSRPRGLRTLADGGRAGLLPRDPPQPAGAHQPLHGAASHGGAFPFRLVPDFPGAVDGSGSRCALE